MRQFYGEALTTTREAWKSEIPVMKGIVSKYHDKNGRIIFEYRVLLTRARSGIVICVPAGNANKNASGFWEDSTRLPEFYDGIYQYLKRLGIEEI